MDENAADFSSFALLKIPMTLSALEIKPSIFAPSNVLQNTKYTLVPNSYQLLHVSLQFSHPSSRINSNPSLFPHSLNQLMFNDPPFHSHKHLQIQLPQNHNNSQLVNHNLTNHMGSNPQKYLSNPKSQLHSHLNRVITILIIVAKNKFLNF